MMNSIFTRALATHLDEALIDSVHYQNESWRSHSRRWTADSRRDASDNSVYYFRATNGRSNNEFFGMTADETRELRRMCDSLSSVSGSYTSMSLYLWLVKHNQLDRFFNNLKEKLNANA